MLAGWDLASLQCSERHWGTDEAALELVHIIMCTLLVDT